MALEDLASMRAIHSSTVLYHATQPTAKLTADHGRHAGHRLHAHDARRLSTLYGRNEVFKVAARKCCVRAKDKVALIGAGVSCTTASPRPDALVAKKIPARVIDLYSVKPVDVEDAAGRRRESPKAG